MELHDRFVSCARRLFVSAGWSLPVPAGDSPGQERGWERSCTFGLSEGHTRGCRREPGLR